MFNNVFTQVFGSRNQRLLKKLNALVTSVAALESMYAALDDAQLAQQTVVLRERLAKGETLDQIRAAAFAVTREAGKRVMGMRHFDVQLVGGAILHEGKIAEIRTGEGKTQIGRAHV